MQRILIDRPSHNPLTFLGQKAAVAVDASRDGSWTLGIVYRTRGGQYVFVEYRKCARILGPPSSRVRLAGGLDEIVFFFGAGPLLDALLAHLRV